MPEEITEAELTVARPHATPAVDVAGDLDTDLGGLTSAEAERRIAIAGPNQLPEPPRRPAVLRFLAHFNDTLIYILLAAAAIKALMADWLDFWVIIGVTVINALVGFLQEGRAERALAGIRDMLSPDASVRRDGAWKSVPADELVPGDVVRLAPGDKVPADLRLFEAHRLRIDEAALTGESVPSAKDVEAVAVDAGVGDRHSMAFSGTIVASGQARGIVTSTGALTEIGRIQSLVSGAGSLATPLTRQLDAFAKVLTLVILGMAALMMAIGRFVHDMPFDELVSAAIGFAVAAIPEGLPALVTITLAIGVQQMARRKAITRKLTAVETLGAVTTVCSDKTGTLTRNEMTVRRIVTPLGGYEVTGLGYAPDGAITRHDGAAPGADVTAVLAVGTLCNEAHIVLDGEQHRLVGEPTEGALKVVAAKGGVSSQGSRRLAVLPFDSEHKFMATLNEGADGARAFLVKGAPDRLLDRSTSQRGADGREAVDPEHWMRIVDELSAEGLRVLAAARRPAAPGTAAVEMDDLEELEFLGVWGIVDPPRPEAVTAIEDCHTAGVRVKMITGDHAGTAVAIAREMGIVDGEQPRVLTGAELEALSQDQLQAVARDVDVYARTSPEHKIRIVRALQSHDEVVAMTGDGVNDAPALTRADVGVAMGIKGTEATKEAAEIVLADDNFATIRSAIREGRRIYDNLRKSIVFILPTNGAQSLVILVAVVFGLALPLTPVQVLWINMVVAITLTLALAYEPAERGIMLRPPRASRRSIISGGELGFVLAVSAVIGGASLGLFYGALAYGSSLDYARTEAITMLALGQLAFLFNSRFLDRSSLTRDVLTGNPMVWWSALALIVLQLAYTYLPFMNELFESRPLDAASWLAPVGLSIAVFFVIEGMKWVRRRFAADS
ncbi:HAD-IC family P-type ATPase [Microbacterium thalassium]|uniref:Magnesium-transporting ATPase (P-type) n=1 Tax=Microbacterium thalassium TaxID=362649 RepID=A0A7X0FRM1_9MICO|nr:HAD-IC family P-type ATPase [Microbacterium thalassium]MBB6392435.1 magnesium-transporting ATPase (P-type) [Microbacterium thalassium]GLK25032.1 carbonate dehydratase [Microbacterium thalassium]